MPGLIYSALDHSNGNDSNGAQPTLHNPEENDGYSSDPPDASPSLVELQSEDFPTYFSERDGRLFHSSSSPYPLPVDTPEQERLTLLHNISRQFLGANYVGPVPDILAFEGRQKIALDVCTGNGIWVMEMARDFPRVHFRGFDIVPIATRYPLPNVQFEVDDANTRYRWSNSTFDLVHAREISLAVRDYRTVLEEIGRVLRPGGLFVSCEWGPHPAFDPSLSRDVSIHAPASCRFSDAVSEALVSCRSLRPIAAQIPSLLASAGNFTDISSTQHHVPIGAWQTDPSLRSIGAACLKAHERYADSIRPLLIEAGWAERDVESLVADYVREITTVRGLVSVLYTVHARKA